MPAKNLFKFTVNVTANERKLDISFSPGNEHLVTEFLIAITDGSLYTSCIENLETQMNEDPKKADSVHKICGDIVKQTTEKMNRPVIRPSQVFARGENGEV